MLAAWHSAGIPSFFECRNEALSNALIRFRDALFTGVARKNKRVG